jgi:hypothetical protein
VLGRRASRTTRRYQPDTVAQSAVPQNHPAQCTHIAIVPHVLGVSRINYELLVNKYVKSLVRNWQCHYAPDSTIMRMALPLYTWQYHYAHDSTIMCLIVPLCTIQYHYATDSTIMRLVVPLCTQQFHYMPGSTIMRLMVPLCTRQYHYTTDRTIMRHAICGHGHFHDFRKMLMIFHRNFCVPGWTPLLRLIVRIAWTATLCRWVGKQLYCSVKPLTWRHCMANQKTWILRITAVITWNLDRWNCACKLWQESGQ